MFDTDTIGINVGFIKDYLFIAASEHVLFFYGLLCFSNKTLMIYSVLYIVVISVKMFSLIK